MAEVVKDKQKKKANSKERLTAPKKVKILFSIVQRQKVDFYLDVLEGYEVNFQTVFYGKGTAPTEIAHFLGLVDNDKAIILSVIREDRIKEVLIAFEDKYFKTRNGQGIAFTVPVSSVIGKSLYEFLINLGGKE